MEPNRFDRAIIAATRRLPDNWAGLRLAILLRRAVTMRLSNGGGLDVERWGLKLRLHPRDNGCEKGLLFTPQMWERVECDALLQEIINANTERRTFNFVDVGANVGLFSFFVAAQAAAARVLAIEPEPGNLARLRFNLAANPELPIKPVRAALGSTEFVAVDVNHKDRGGTRTRPLTNGLKDHRGLVAHCLTLHELLCKEAFNRVDALKIDVEGAEGDILLPFFRDAPVDLWPRLLIVEGDELLGELANYGYKLTARTRLNIILRRP